MCILLPCFNCFIPALLAPPLSIFARLGLPFLPLERLKKRNTTFLSRLAVSLCYLPYQQRDNNISFNLDVRLPVPAESILQRVPTDLFILWYAFSRLGA